MKNGTNEGALPTLIGDVITDQKHYIDNLFADTWKKLKFNARIKGAGFTKRSGIDITEAVFRLLLWKWINVSSIAMFSRKALGMFSRAKKDVMYEVQHLADAKLVVVAYGSVARIIKSSVAMAREAGMKVGLFRPITLYPYPYEQLAEVAKNVKNFMAVELSTGQVSQPNHTVYRPAKCLSP